MLRTTFIFLFALILVGCQRGEGFVEWDSNDDDAMSEAEFSASADDRDMFTEWDSNQDDNLDEDEFNTGYSTWYGGYTPDAGFDEWDTNDDNNVNRKEFNRGSFNMADENRDTMLDENEFTKWEESGN